jgi:hypothetical protein
MAKRTVPKKSLAKSPGWRAGAGLSALAIGVALFFWQPWKIRPPELYPDFLMFPSARTFDPPGTIFGVNQEGVRFDVTDISKAIKASEGEEFVPDQVGRRRVSGTTLANALGQISAASLSFSGDHNVNLKLTNVRREKTTDSDIDKVIGNALPELNLRRDNKYYVIRETIAARGIEYTLSTKDSEIAGAHLTAQRAGSGKVEVQRSHAGEIKLMGAYDSPARIFYKVEEIKFQSSGINGELSVSRTPVDKNFHWRESADSAAQQ